MENPLKNLIEIIKAGSPEEVKEAQKKVEEFWHEVFIPKREEGRRTFLIFLDEIKKFDEIQDIDHQAYFINTLKWPFWSIGEEYFEEWADFILKYIQHPSGKIRQAIVSATDYLIIDIRVDLKTDFGKELSKEDKQRTKKNRERFGNFVCAVENLLDKYYEPRFNRYKYISSMPVSVYKSLQKLLVEVLLRSDYYEKLYEDFLKNGGLIRTTPGEAEIISRVEDRLQKLIDQYNLNGKLTLKMIKDWIWQASGDTTMDAVNRFHKKVFGYFNNVRDITKLNEILHAFKDAWNHFPHQFLRGKSPNLMVKETLKKNPNLKRKEVDRMPDFIIGGQKISWDDYWAMTREAEELQKPFRHWVKEDVLPKYKDFLAIEERLPSEIVKKNCKVAEIFFGRAMWLGFISFDEIGPEFVKYGFPRWWQTHVLGSNLDENEVWHSLKYLFRFLEIKYNVNTEKFFGPGL